MKLIAEFLHFTSQISTAPSFEATMSYVKICSYRQQILFPYKRQNYLPL